MFRTSPSIARSAAQHGFSVIELMVVVAIVAVLAALATPSFTPIIERWRVRNSIEALQHSYYLARSEAIKRAGGVAMTRLASSDGCTSSGPNDWKCGWVITDNAGNTLHQTTIATNTDLTIVFGGDPSQMRFDRYGMVRDSAGTAMNSLEAQVMPKSKPITNVSSQKLCLRGGRLSRISGTENC